jgi:AraC-like DNA-binding protein
MYKSTDLAAAIGRHAGGEGILPTPVPGLHLIRMSRTTEPLHVLHEPAVCIIAQGAKVVMQGDTAYAYDASKYLVVSVDLPLAGHVTRAEPDEPYLCFRLDLSPRLLAELSVELGEALAPPRSEAGAAVYLADTSPELIDAATRLTMLLDRPQDIAVLAPLLVKELHYRLLTGPSDHIIRHIAHGSRRLAQVSRAVDWIKQHFMAPLSIDQLSEIAGMSTSALHEHFKAVTSLSPLQYQKQLRLQEARRLMVSGQKDAQGAALAVGYESGSQFSREYARQFGFPPARDAARLRAAGDSALTSA